MKLLAFETSTRWISVALWCDGAVIERKEELPNSGSEHLLPWATRRLRGASSGDLIGPKRPVLTTLERRTAR